MSEDTAQLPPEAAAKVLGADLRNTVAQVAAGQRLPEADRARLETTVLTNADPDIVARLARERQANLLKIWSSGRRRLTPSELQELEPILPPEVLARPPTKRAGYRHPLAHYVEIYNAAERTLKHWISLGRKAQSEPDLPPLDDPPRMKDWYARNKKNRVPDRLIQLASQAAQIGADTSPAPDCGHVSRPASAPAPTMPSLDQSSPDSAQSPPPPSAPGSDDTDEAAYGYSATLDRLRKAEAAAGQKYTSLILESGREAEAEQARRAWQQITKELRAYEKDAEEVLQKSGQSWVAAEVIAAIHETHVPLRDSILSLYDRIEARLRTATGAEARQIYREEVRRIFSDLIANRFTAAAFPPAAAGE